MFAGISTERHPMRRLTRGTWLCRSFAGDEPLVVVGMHAVGHGLKNIVKKGCIDNGCG